MWAKGIIRIVNYIAKITTLKTASNYAQCKHPAHNYAMLFWDGVEQVILENTANYLQCIYVIWLEKHGYKTEPVFWPMHSTNHFKIYFAALPPDCSAGSNQFTNAA